MERNAKDVLLVVAVHGWMGYAADWDNFELGLKEQFNELNKSDNNKQLFVLKSSVSEGSKTLDGINNLSHRLAVEAVDWVTSKVIPKITDDDAAKLNIYFSIVGHSLGGIIARASLKHLLAQNESITPEASSGKSTTTDPITSLFQGLSSLIETGKVALFPLTYMSISSPHLGSRRVTELRQHTERASAAKRSSSLIHSGSTGSLLTNVILSNVMDLFGTFFIGQTGKELQLLDGSSKHNRNSLPRSKGKEATSPVDDNHTSETGNKPLLVQMADADGPYMKALSRFKFGTLVAAVDGDLIVPYVTAAVASVNPHLDVKRDEPTFKILSVSGFDSQLVERGWHFKSTERTPPFLKAVIDTPFTNFEDSPIGVHTNVTDHLERLHHVDGTRSSSDGDIRVSNLIRNDATLGQLIADHRSETMIPLSLLTELQKTMSHFRRINVHMCLPSLLHRNAGHALMVGKVEGMVPKNALDIAKGAAWVCARVCIADFLEATSCTPI